MPTIASLAPKTAAAKPLQAASLEPPGEKRIAIHGVSWDLYDQLSNAIGQKQRVFLAYDGKDLEIMVKGLAHEDYKYLFGQLVDAIAHDLRVQRRGLGETTWKREALAKGLEADQCYFFRKEKLEMVLKALARKSNDLAGVPNPDLAVEVELSRPEVDRMSIYQALEVSEVWRFDGESMVILQLGPDGVYAPAESSMFLAIRAEEVVQWLLKEDSSDLVEWRNRLQVWTQSVLAPRQEKTGPDSRVSRPE